MKNKNHSIKEIASKLNVSVTTVSFVLNGKAEEKRISEAVTKKILAYIKKINYKPNQVAQSLRTGKSKIIVLMVEDISNSFFAKLVRIVEDIAYDEGYKVLFCSNENDDKKSNEFISLFNERQVDGFIIVPSAGIKKTIKKLVDDNVPVVLFDRYFPDIETNYVVIDNENSAFTATTHLIENQFRNIAFITTGVQQTQMLDRAMGYKRAIKDHHLKENILILPYREQVPEKKQEMLSNFLQENSHLDAIFFSTNYLTQTGLEVIKKDFPSLKNKLGIVAFDDNEFFKIFTPSISAVSQPLKKIGHELMRIMLKLLKDEGAGTSIEKVCLKTKLKIRDSSFKTIYNDK